ncbi:A-kinase-interacting protein 1 isoform X2 [Nerophis lumbriciformis]|uniref:A-kinase-interacting protein 1 isoform X2 n=1 Tax=Nerophis lumbriciformis TaxID=546530 RepID=UPI002ADF3C9B|nr:A-kinase-interacting protein 1 isoform X2 [Nerophis lumbriciformis]
MTTLDWIESSLERSARLGLQVLERASRRKVDWTTPPHIYATDMPEDPVTRTKRSRRELEEAFATIAEYMVTTNYYCKKFYQLAGCVDMPKSEKKHMSRFHKHINAYPRPPGRHRHVGRGGLLHRGGPRRVRGQRQPSGLTAEDSDDQPRRRRDGQPHV